MIAAYLLASLLLAVGYLGVRAAAALPLAHAQRLRLARAVFAGALALPLLLQFLPAPRIPQPPVQVWSGDVRGRAEPWVLVSLPPALGAPALPHLPSDPLPGARTLLALGIAAGLAVFLAHERRLRRVVGALPRLKRLGRISLRVSPGLGSPYSAHTGRELHVVLPEQIFFHPSDLRIALRHELQHHRQLDTLWVHGVELVRILFFWNPAAQAWARLTEELQEFACDEALVGRRNLTAQAYGRCLLRAAESIVGLSPAPAGTTGMAARVHGHLLKRRIKQMLRQRNPRPSRWLPLFAGSVVLLSMVSLAQASRGLVLDRRVTMEQAQEMARRISEASDIPITINESVLERLNRYVGTPEGRRQVRAGLDRMPRFQSLVEAKLAEYGFPAELLAIPLFESGFRNEAISPPPYRAAGIWQFVPQTARNYRLRVDGSKDERFNPEKETDAAMRYYRDLFVKFGDWRLVLKAYNEGERRVQDLMDRYHTRDAWKLEKLSTTEGYLSGAMAMMIILKNPSLLAD